MDVTANLSVIDVRKNYPGVLALKGITLEFQAGEVHALIGKNGAGKSTLIRILSGSTQPTSGQVLVNGTPVVLATPRDALLQGIATVYQELSLVPNLTVGHNIMLTNLPTKLGGLVVDWSAVYERAAEVLRELNLDIDVRAPVSALGVASQQMVEIAKATVFKPRALLLDEPTSALADHETDSLFQVIQHLTARGVAVVYISHRLRELRRIAQRVSVLRDGQLIGTIGIDAADPHRVGEMMFGELTPKHRPAAVARAPETILEVRDLRQGEKLRGVNLRVARGEILGIAGLVGSGRTELLRAISGADRFAAGSVRVAEQVIGRPTVRRMMRYGVGLAPENRKEAGLVLGLSTRENICLASLDRVSQAAVIRRHLEDTVVRKSVRDLHIKVADTESPVAALSGGNQQKVVLAKWLNTNLRVLLLDEPTRGIDILAKQQIFQVMWDLSAAGIASVFVSSELEELVDVCHRIAIMHAGEICGYVPAEDVSPQQLFSYCADPASSRHEFAHG